MFDSKMLYWALVPTVIVAALSGAAVVSLIWFFGV